MNALKMLALAAVITISIAGPGISSAIAGSHDQHTMPLRGFGTLRVVLTAGTINCLAPDGTVITPFPAELDALARYTGMGLTVGTIIADTCDFNPINGTLEVTGVAYQTAANGDQVYAPYSGVFQPDFSFTLDIEVVGGTGRFTNACGAADSHGVLDPVTGAGESWLAGWISTVGFGADNGVCD
jgi:hypothetical protein